MGECATAIDIANGPNTFNVGAALVVDRDIASCIGNDTRLVEAKVISVWLSTNRKQQVTAMEPRRASAADHIHGDTGIGILH